MLIKSPLTKGEIVTRAQSKGQIMVIRAAECAFTRSLRWLGLELLQGLCGAIAAEAALQLLGSPRTPGNGSGVKSCFNKIMDAHAGSAWR